LKGKLDFDPEQFEHGPATLFARRILSLWASIDWFVPPAVGADVRATRLLEEHSALARAARPDLFPAEPAVTTVTAGWDEFRALCERVRSPDARWDWKYSALKPLSSSHSKTRGWSLSDAARTITADDPPRKGELFIKVGPNAMWMGCNPSFDFDGLSPADVAASSFYLGYAHMDVLECIEWQLAERSDDESGNPFVPLVRCYAEGHYPFSLGPSEIMLFAFNDRP
jgi:hypothetical protein